MLLSELKKYIKQEFGYTLTDAFVQKNAKEIIHNKKGNIIKDADKIINWFTLRKHCEQNYIAIGALQKQINEKYNLNININAIYSIKNIELERLNEKLVFVKNPDIVFDYYSLPITQRRSISQKGITKKNNKITYKMLCQYFNKDYSTIKNILCYLKKDKPDNECIELINNFLSEHPNTKQFFFEQTCLNKYGVKNVFTLSSTQEKREQTCKQNYGVNYPLQLNTNKQKLSKLQKEKTEQQITQRKKTLENNIAEYEKTNNCISAVNLCKKYNLSYKSYHIGEIARLLNIEYFLFKNSLFISNDNIQQIVDFACKNKISSCGEKQIKDYIQSIYNGTVLCNTRNVIKPKELDIFIPEKKIAIEYNGLYWHSDNFIDSNFHLNKTKECEKQGIRLIHIFEDMWLFKQDICKSIIASALGIYQKKIYARKCNWKAVDNNVAKLFLEQNHIQGAINAKYNFGLYYNNELVQIACWGQNRFSNNELELLRMCSKLNTQVIGGFSKIIKHSLPLLPAKQFISYVDKSLFDKKGYIATNFTPIKESKPSYFYVKKGSLIRENRIKYQKHKLPTLLENYDKTLTEKQNMKNNEYMLIYDCGTTKMLYKQ